ncbi:hypothetical protein B6V73_19600 [Thioclava sp. JM3]|nr:hypothetical protein B6V73_19600 [Thioclava sp. JM3]
MLKGMIIMTGRFDTKLLPEGLRATGYSVDGAILAIDAELMNAEVICPGCGQRSSRRHGRYVRHLLVFPAHGRAVQVRFSVQRFRCVASQCSITTFTEKVPDCLACRHGRRTGRFQDLVAYLGRAVGGRPLVGTTSRRPTAYASHRSNMLCRNWRRAVCSSTPSPP